MTTDRLSRVSFGTPPLIRLPIRRKVFVSYSHLNRQEAKTFVDTFGGPGAIFIPKAIGVSDTEKASRMNADSKTCGIMAAQANLSR